MPTATNARAENDPQQAAMRPSRNEMWGAEAARVGAQPLQARPPPQSISRVRQCSARAGGARMRLEMHIPQSIHRRSAAKCIADTGPDDEQIADTVRRPGSSGLIFLILQAGSER